MIDAPKYSAIEVERRWLVDLSRVPELSSLPCREIEDLYIAASRLRLRRMTGPDGSSIFKLGKKYGDGRALAQAVTNLYLTEREHAQLAALPGAVAIKRRYAVAGGALDLYVQPVNSPAIFEVEFADEAAAQAYRPPAFVTREITLEPSFSGASLATPHLKEPG